MPRLAPLVVAFLLLACSRPRPSPEYDRARTLWADLVRAQPAAPADDPRADEVLRLLGTVPADSADATAATALRDRIVRERHESADERARREEIARRAAMPTALPDAPAPAAASQGAPARPAAPAVPAVGVGMKLEDFRAVYGACFVAAGPVQIDAPGREPRAGEMWSMKDDAGCREAHPGLVGQLVLMADGAVAGVSPATNLKRVEERKPVQLAPLPDGSTGMVVDGKVVPIPPGAKLEPAPAAAPGATPAPAPAAASGAGR